MSALRNIHPCHVLIASVSLAWSFGCGSDDTDNDPGGVECGGNGELQGGVCDCDDGYMQAPGDETTCVPVVDDEGPNTASALRLAVGDASGRVTLLSLADGSVAGTFDLTGVARLYATESGRFLAAVQAAENRVDFFDSGIALEENGGDVGVVVEEPRKLKYALAGEDLSTENPVHFVSHSGYVTLHFDGAWDDAEGAHVMARNVIIRESELLSDAPVPTLELEGVPQHGVSVVTESGHLLITEPSLDRAVW